MNDINNYHLERKKLQERTYKLEKDIKILLVEYVEETGLKVGRIDIEEISIASGGKAYIEISVDVRL